MMTQGNTLFFCFEEVEALISGAALFLVADLLELGVSGLGARLFFSALASWLKNSMAISSVPFRRAC